MPAVILAGIRITSGGLPILERRQGHVGAHVSASSRYPSAPIAIRVFLYTQFHRVAAPAEPKADYCPSFEESESTEQALPAQEGAECEADSGSS